MKDSQEKIIKKYISLVLSEADFRDGETAGIIVVKKFNETWKPLCLIWKDKFDIPKGKIEPGENTLNAAKRETYEESRIYDLKFLWGMDFIRVKNLTVYVAATTQEPKIERNQATGEYEHDRALWINWDTLINRSNNKISMAVQWARRKISENNLL